MSVTLLPQKPKSDPARHLIDGLQSVYERMPEEAQRRCADMYLAMISEGVKVAREGHE